MGNVIKDLGYSLRSLRRSPGFTFLAIVILALGIAGNTLVFSVVNACLLRPLPYPEADRLMMVHLFVEGGQSSDDLPAGSFFMLQEAARSFESIAASYPIDVGINLAGPGKPQYVQGLRVSRGFFATLGIGPKSGRTFRPEEDAPGGPNTVVLSYALWEQNFHSDPEIIGRQVSVNDESYVIAGVMPRGFRSFPDADLWLPLQLSPATAASGNNYQVIVRLRKGVSVQEAQRELDTRSSQAGLRTIQRTPAVNTRLVLHRLQDFEVSEVRHSLTMLFGAVLGVLLIACLNLAVLSLVRGSAKGHEIGIRLALGSSRTRLVQVLLMESGILAVGGGVLGLILAKETLPFMLALIPSDLPLNSAIGIDRHVVLFAGCLAMLTPVFFGLAPAIRATRFDLKSMAGESVHATAGAGQTRLGNILVTMQTALSMVLLSAAILQLDTLVRLQSQPLGFDPQNLLVAQVSLTSKRYEKAWATAQLMENIGAHLHTRHGVKAVAGVSGLPLDKSLNLPTVPDRDYDKAVYASQYWIVSGDYLAAMNIRLVSGRSFSPSDGKGAAPVALISENLARRWWPHSSALGHFVTAGYRLGAQFADTPRQIIGVVADTYTAGAHRPPPPAIYVPAAETPDAILAFTNKQFLTSILVRTGDKEPGEEHIREAIDSADPSLPLVSMRPLTQIEHGSLARPRFYASLAGGFGGFAVTLTAIGLYGLLSYRVSLRTKEIAVRMAMGAPRSKVITMVIRQGMKLVAGGLFLGLIGSYYVHQLVGAMPYNRGELIIILYAAVLLGGVTAFTSFLTAFQAASVEPMVVLRSE